MLHRRVLTYITVLLLIGGYALSYSKVKVIRSDLPKATKRAEALAVDPTLLKIVSGPFKGLLADYLLLKASVFIGGASDPVPEDWEAVYTLFKQSLYLDPRFFQTGYYAQGILAWRKGMHHKAIELLKYQAEYRDWDWEPLFYLGFDYFYYLHDYAKAAKYMRQCSQKDGAPAIAATLAARLAQRSGDSITAIALLKTLYDRAEDDKIKAQYAKRLEAHTAVYIIERAIAQFEKAKGRLPNSLDELLASGIMNALPANPYGGSFYYDRSTGRVSFDRGL